MLALVFALTLQDVGIPELGVLVFSKTAAFRHDSIADGRQMMSTLGRENAWMVTFTENSTQFVDALPRVRVVVFLNTTGDVLDDKQQEAFSKWYKRGGGYVGIHAAADTEHDWPWYGKLVGAYFKTHPAIQQANVIVEAPTHPAIKHLPKPWYRTDEWYDYATNPRKSVKVLARLDAKSYKGSDMDDDHPIVWCQEFDGGRSFYTGLGHTTESYTEKEFVEMIRQAILWAAKRSL